MIVFTVNLPVSDEDHITVVPCLSLLRNANESVNEFTLYYLLSCCLHISLVRLGHHVLGTCESRVVGIFLLVTFFSDDERVVLS